MSRTCGFLVMAAVTLLVARTTRDAMADINPKHPNILLICVDDLRPELGCYGSTLGRTPNIDRLAAQSRIFTRHYVQSAVCGPSRCSLLTGRRIHSWDCWADARKRDTAPSRPVSFAQVFRQAGYRTVCIGKISHLPGGVMDEAQTVHQVPFSWDRAFAPVGPWETPWRAFFAYDDAQAYNRVIRMSKDQPRLPYESADVDDQGYADGLNAAAAVRQLQELATSNQPFLLATGFYKPHLPFNAPQKYWDLYRPEAIPLADHPRPPEGVDPQISIHDSFEVTTHYEWPSGAGQINDEQARTLRHAYLACVSYVDAQIGKVLDELQRLGLEDRTIVVLWSDHGWHLGEHGMFGKQTNFEIATRSPLIVRLPHMPQPGASTAALVETVDVFPTLTDLCDLPTPTDLPGRSLAGLLEDPQAAGKPFAFSFHPRDRLMGRTVRTERWRLVEWRDAQENVVQTELYDHTSDPGENRNVADDAENQAVLADLRRLLRSVDFAKTISLE
jgi:arylsulfatase A-like enzyme